VVRACLGVGGMNEIPLIDFGNPDELRRWLRTQPRQVGIALAARSALRVLPSATIRTGAITLADLVIIQNHFRLLSIAWIAFGSFPVDRGLRIAARARSAAAVSLPIGTLSTSPAASAACRSAAEVARAVANTGRKSSDAVIAAINEAFSAEANEADARLVSALADDISLLDSSLRSFLRGNVPLWRNGVPTRLEPRWREMKSLLLNLPQDWQVWTIWYDDRLDGRVRSTGREVAYVDLPDEIWAQGPAAVNAHIIKRIEEHEPLPQPISPQDNVPDGQWQVIQAVPDAPAFTSQKTAEQWLENKPPEWAFVLAARSALRSLPALASDARLLAGTIAEAEGPIILLLFRAVAAAWVAAAIPKWAANSDLVPPHSDFDRLNPGSK
jgi:hypothetical protein